MVVHDGFNAVFSRVVCRVDATPVTLGNRESEMGNKSCRFLKDGNDIIAGIELRNGKENPFGWSTHEVWHIEDAGAYVPAETHIADLYCGEPINFADGYSCRIEDIPEATPALQKSSGTGP